MNELIGLIRQFIQGLRLWIIVTPWQQAVRVRCGRWAREMGPGLHYCIPLVDLWYVQSVRPRIACFGRQTVTTADGQPLTVTGGLRYGIGSVLDLYQTMDHAESTLQNIPRSHLAAYISTHCASECTPIRLEQHVSATLATALEEYGLTHVQLLISDCMVAKTYRIVDNGAWGNPDGILQTNQAIGQ